MRAATGTAVGREKRPRAESRKAKRSRPAGRGVGGRRERIGGGRVMGESVRGVARWYGNERFRGPVGGQAGGRRGREEEGEGAAAAAAAAAGGSAARDRVGLVRRTPQRVT